eukprot:159131-Lingulodinium_polyedra.AAC.1
MGGAMRALEPHGCCDVSLGTNTVLLDDDARVSDVGDWNSGEAASVPLCAHHAQMYRAPMLERKCGIP